MSDLWRDMGVIHWPLAFSMLAVAGLTLYSGMRLYRPGATPDLLTKAWLDAILFWGGFATIAGVLGTLVGLVIAAQSIEAMGTVSPSLVWGGVKVALISSALGTLILAAAALFWFGLQLRWRVLEAREVGDA